MYGAKAAAAVAVAVDAAGGCCCCCLHEEGLLQVPLLLLQLQKHNLLMSHHIILELEIVLRCMYSASSKYLHARKCMDVLCGPPVTIAGTRLIQLVNPA